MTMLNYAYGTALFLGLFWAAIQPGHQRWRDDGCCRSLCWHTLRIPSNYERLALWRARSAFINEYNQKETA